MRASLRAARRTRCDATTPDERARAASDVAARLLDLDVVRAARCIAIYEALSTEEDLSVLWQSLPTTRFLTPITLPDLDLSWADLRTREELGREAIAETDVVVAPAMAIGPNGERLGKGGGCYDRALPRRRPGVPVIAVVFPEEVGLDVPTEPHDERVDGVVTREGSWMFTSRSTDG